MTLLFDYRVEIEVCAICLDRDVPVMVVARPGHQDTVSPRICSYCVLRIDDKVNEGDRT